MAQQRTHTRFEFDALARPHLRSLKAYCYRMTGSLGDAEDAAQETLVRAWRHLERFEGRSSFRAWLFRIATNVCLDALQKRSARSLPQLEVPPASPDAPLPPPAEERWLEPYPDAELPAPDALHSPEARYTEREGVALAFLVAIHRLTPRLRAVLLLREVVGMTAEEVAALLETTPAAVNSAVQRARRALTGLERRPARPTRQQESQLVRRYIRAWMRSDTADLVALLKHDATFAMPPYTLWLRGVSAIGAFLRARLFAAPAGTYRCRAVRANGRPAVAIYQRADRGPYRPTALCVLEVSQSGKLAAIDAFLRPGLFERFGLPRQIPSRRS